MPTYSLEEQPENTVEDRIACVRRTKPEIVTMGPAGIACQRATYEDLRTIAGRRRLTESTQKTDRIATTVRDWCHEESIATIYEYPSKGGGWSTKAPAEEGWQRYRRHDRIYEVKDKNGKKQQAMKRTMTGTTNRPGIAEARSRSTSKRNMVSGYIKSVQFIEEKQDKNDKNSKDKSSDQVKHSIGKFWDEVTGTPLNMELVDIARAEEMEEIMKHGVRDKVSEEDRGQGADRDEVDRHQ